VLNHVCIKLPTTPFIIDNMAVSLGLLDAFSIMVIARIAAEGAGDRKA
jgi:hypothetical protein